jgi:ABC-type spermidine/putrescine transport system permease subunit II
MAQAAPHTGVGIEVAAPVRSRPARDVANTWLWRAFLAGVGLLLFGPIVLLFLFAFNDSNILAFPLEGFTLRWFGEAFDDGLLRQALANSFGIAFVVAPLCLVLGTLAAFGLTRFRFRGRSAIGGLVGAPLVLPWLVVGIAALLFYARLEVSLNVRTVVATQVICTFPLVTAIVSAQLFRFEKVQEEAARRRSSRSPGRSTTTRSASSRSGSSRRSRSGCTRACAIRSTPRS